MTKRYTSILLVFLLDAGCAKDRFERDQFLGTVSITSAMVVALPLIPVGIGYQGYQLAYGNARTAEKEKALQEQLDPVYQKRAEMIRARSPKADVYQSWTNGVVAFLGSIHPVNLVNLDPSEPCMSHLAGSRDQIEHDAFLKYLDTLMSDDVLQQRVKGVEYFSDIYKDFLRAGWKYKDAFNREMCRLSQESDPAPWPPKK